MNKSTKLNNNLMGGQQTQFSVGSLKVGSLALRVFVVWPKKKIIWIFQIKQDRADAIVSCNIPSNNLAADRSFKKSFFLSLSYNCALNENMIKS